MEIEKVCVCETERGWRERERGTVTVRYGEREKESA